MSIVNRTNSLKRSSVKPGASLSPAGTELTTKLTNLTKYGTTFKLAQFLKETSFPKKEALNLINEHLKHEKKSNNVKSHHKVASVLAEFVGTLSADDAVDCVGHLIEAAPTEQMGQLILGMMIATAGADNLEFFQKLSKKYETALKKTTASFSEEMASVVMDDGRSMGVHVLEKLIEFSKNSLPAFKDLAGKLVPELFGGKAGLSLVLKGLGKDVLGALPNLEVLGKGPDSPWVVALTQHVQMGDLGECVNRLYDASYKGATLDAAGGPIEAYLERASKSGVHMSAEVVAVALLSGSRKLEIFQLVQAKMPEIFVEGLLVHIDEIIGRNDVDMKATNSDIKGTDDRLHNLGIPLPASDKADLEQAREVFVHNRGLLAKQREGLVLLRKTLSPHVPRTLGTIPDELKGMGDVEVLATRWDTASISSVENFIVRPLMGEEILPFKNLQRQVERLARGHVGQRMFNDPKLGHPAGGLLKHIVKTEIHDRQETCSKIPTLTLQQLKDEKIRLEKEKRDHADYRYLAKKDYYDGNSQVGVNLQELVLPKNAYDIHSELKPLREDIQKMIGLQLKMVEQAIKALESEQPGTNFSGVMSRPITPAKVIFGKQWTPPGVSLRAHLSKSLQDLTKELRLVGDRSSHGADKKERVAVLKIVTSRLPGLIAHLDSVDGDPLDYLQKLQNDLLSNVAGKHLHGGPHADIANIIDLVRKMVTDQIKDNAQSAVMRVPGSAHSTTLASLQKASRVSGSVITLKSLQQYSPREAVDEAVAKLLLDRPRLNALTGVAKELENFFDTRTEGVILCRDVEAYADEVIAKYTTLNHVLIMEFKHELVVALNLLKAQFGAVGRVDVQQDAILRQLQATHAAGDMTFSLGDSVSNGKIFTDMRVLYGKGLPPTVVKSLAIKTFVNTLRMANLGTEDGGALNVKAWFHGKHMGKADRDNVVRLLLDLESFIKQNPNTLVVSASNLREVSVLLDLLEVLKESGQVFDQHGQPIDFGGVIQNYKDLLQKCEDDSSGMESLPSTIGSIRSADLEGKALLAKLVSSRKRFDGIKDLYEQVVALESMGVAVDSFGANILHGDANDPNIPVGGLGGVLQELGALLGLDKEVKGRGWGKTPGQFTPSELHRLDELMTVLDKLVGSSNGSTVHGVRLEAALQTVGGGANALQLRADNSSRLFVVSVDSFETTWGKPFSFGTVHPSSVKSLEAFFALKSEIETLQLQIKNQPTLKQAALVKELEGKVTQLSKMVSTLASAPRSPMDTDFATQQSRYELQLEKLKGCPHLLEAIHASMAEKCIARIDTAVGADNTALIKTLQASLKHAPLADQKRLLGLLEQQKIAVSGLVDSAKVAVAQAATVFGGDANAPLTSVKDGLHLSHADRTKLDTAEQLKDAEVALGLARDNLSRVQSSCVGLDLNLPLNAEKLQNAQIAHDDALNAYRALYGNSNISLAESAKIESLSEVKDAKAAFDLANHNYTQLLASFPAGTALNARQEKEVDAARVAVIEAVIALDNVRTMARLTQVKDGLSLSKADRTKLDNAEKLKEAQDSFNLAQTNFLAAETHLATLAAGVTPQDQAKFDSAKRALDDARAEVVSISQDNLSESQTSLEAQLQSITTSYDACVAHVTTRFGDEVSSSARQMVLWGELRGQDAAFVPTNQAAVVGRLVALKGQQDAQLGSIASALDTAKKPSVKTVMADTVTKMATQIMDAWMRAGDETIPEESPAFSFSLEGYGDKQMEVAQEIARGLTDIFSENGVPRAGVVISLTHQGLTISFEPGMDQANRLVLVNDMKVRMTALVPTKDYSPNGTSTRFDEAEQDVKSYATSIVTGAAALNSPPDIKGLFGQIMQGETTSKRILLEYLKTNTPFDPAKKNMLDAVAAEIFNNMPGILSPQFFSSAELTVIFQAMTPKTAGGDLDYAAGLENIEYVLTSLNDSDTEKNGIQLHAFLSQFLPDIELSEVVTAITSITSVPPDISFLSTQVLAATMKLPETMTELLDLLHTCRTNISAGTEPKLFKAIAKRVLTNKACLDMLFFGDVSLPPYTKDQWSALIKELGPKEFGEIFNDKWTRPAQVKLYLLFKVSDYAKLARDIFVPKPPPRSVRVPLHPGTDYMIPIRTALESFDALYTAATTSGDHTYALPTEEEYGVFSAAGPLANAIYDAADAYEAAPGSSSATLPRRVVQSRSNLHEAEQYYEEVISDPHRVQEERTQALGAFKAAATAVYDNIQRADAEQKFAKARQVFVDAIKVKNDDAGAKAVLEDAKVVFKAAVAEYVTSMKSYLIPSDDSHYDLASPPFGLMYDRAQATLDDVLDNPKSTKNDLGHAVLQGFSKTMNLLKAVRTTGADYVTAKQGGSDVASTAVLKEAAKKRDAALYALADSIADSSVNKGIKKALERAQNVYKQAVTKFYAQDTRQVVEIANMDEAVQVYHEAIEHAGDVVQATQEFLLAQSTFEQELKQNPQIGLPAKRSVFIDAVKAFSKAVMGPEPANGLYDIATDPLRTKYQEAVDQFEADLLGISTVDQFKVRVDVFKKATGVYLSGGEKPVERAANPANPAYDFGGPNLAIGGGDNPLYMAPQGPDIYDATKPRSVSSDYAVPVVRNAPPLGGRDRVVPVKRGDKPGPVYAQVARPDAAYAGDIDLLSNARATTAEKQTSFERILTAYLKKSTLERAGNKKVLEAIEDYVDTQIAVLSNPAADTDAKNAAFENVVRGCDINSVFDKHITAIGNFVDVQSDILKSTSSTPGEKRTALRMVFKAHSVLRKAVNGAEKAQAAMKLGVEKAPTSFEELFKEELEKASSGDASQEQLDSFESIMDLILIKEKLITDKPENFKRMRNALKLRLKSLSVDSESVKLTSVQERFLDGCRRNLKRLSDILEPPKPRFFSRKK